MAKSVFFWLFAFFIAYGQIWLTASDQKPYPNTALGAWAMNDQFDEPVVPKYRQPMDRTSYKFTLRPESMPLPLICHTWWFWMFTVLPLPFFNGALLRWIIDSKYVRRVRMKVVRYVEIRPNDRWDDKKDQPDMNKKKGYQYPNMFYSDMDLHQSA